MNIIKPGLDHLSVHSPDDNVYITWFDERVSGSLQLNLDEAIGLVHAIIPVIQEAGGPHLHLVNVPQRGALRGNT